MGKTALLDYAANSSGSLSVVRISGVQDEREFGFAALHCLLVPFLGELDVLPQPQRTALLSAFGLSKLSPADPFLVGLATLTLPAHRASTQGLCASSTTASGSTRHRYRPSPSSVGGWCRELGLAARLPDFGRSPEPGWPASPPWRSAVCPHRKGRGRQMISRKPPEPNGEK
jgi:hypothetical protein